MTDNKNNYNDKKINTVDQDINIEKMEKRVNMLIKRFWAMAFLIVAILLSGVIVFSNLYYERIALALFGDYTTKADGSTLQPVEWNNLDEDFVTLEGDNLINGTLTAFNLCIEGGKCLSDISPTCEIFTNSCLAKTCEVSCDPGYTLVSGGGWHGWYSRQVVQNKPIGNPPTGWFIEDLDWQDVGGHHTNVRVICCKFD